MADTLWPALPYEEWKDTYTTLHMWTQIVGKVALATAPPLNHSWGIALRLTARGLSTGLLVHETQTFTMEFDFIGHRLLIQTSDGKLRIVELRPRSVGDFYRAVMAALGELSLSVTIWPMSVEVPDPFRLDRDTNHSAYDPAAVNRFWRVLISVERAFAVSRCRFIGKASPVHFFWGAFDLAVTRFSGRTAPLRDGPAFMRDAYSHEVISHGFWPGSPPLLEASFYAYAVPEPSGLKEASVRPSAAYYHKDLGEFILPYEAVRTSSSPEEVIGQFIDSTYEAAATLARWDRVSLDRQLAAS